ncbi:hypothetical protein NMY22_g2418 [Coprinellus aureogranulatus]|nr:hypothetical protein NMY22_g2418 [Coprinellus aureogranulatus]
MWGAAASSTSADSCCGEVLLSRLLCGSFFRPRPPTPNLRMSLVDEKQLRQLEERVMPVIQPLKDGDVWKAARVWDLAFRDDPILNYIDAGVKETRMRNWWRRITYTFALWVWIRTMIVITIDGGASVVAAKTPGPKNIRNRFLEWLATILLTKLGGMYSRGTKEQRKRANEYSEKVKAVVQAKLGDRIKLMMSVPLVMTAPDRQGRGYASALLREMTNLADTRQEAFALVSINKANEGFYNFHGFQSVGEALLGEGNPAWGGPVLRVQIMLREPRVKLVHGPLKSI